MTFKVKDFYFNKAKKENFLARSVYKLEEIDARFKILRQGDLVLDLGYAPGSWTQYTAEKVGLNGHVYGLDIKEITKSLLGYKNITLFKKDAFELQDIAELGIPRKVDVLLSDMAPNTTGIKSVDQDRSLLLVEKVMDFAQTCLRPGGSLVVKVFDSNAAQVYLKQKKSSFENFQFLKPKSTRSISKEFFVIGKGYRA